MKRFSKVLILILLLNLISSFAYAGEADLPRPGSIEEPVSMALNVDEI